ncbi:MAG TPA: TAXI family TRAP transporter solute-binding subunit [Casimicrobiaceae bacterium]|nr:TAXI family TRAP transporter solute-binding subunit [Casimicrobiaceae bacterium]
MTLDHLAWLTGRERLQATVLIAVLVLVGVYLYVALARTVPPHRIVLASGPDFGVYHEYAKRYKSLLAREGVKVEERMTNGAADNLRLLLDPESGVDVAFIQGGVADSAAADGLVMLSSLYYEPLWIFYTGQRTLSQVTDLRGKRIAAGLRGSGTRALADQVLAVNGLSAPDGAAGTSASALELGGKEALAALETGQADAALFVGGAQTPIIQQALRDPAIKLMSLSDVEVYPRRFPYISQLSLPRGTIDLALDIPDHSVAMIGTRAMLVARADFHPALINLLVDAARVIHGRQGYFEGAGEFPSTEPMDVPVSPYADEHKKFGANFLYRYLPFWLAALAERAIILLVPLAVVLVPLLKLLPDFLRWRVRSRVYRWYGELALLEGDVNTRTAAPPVEEWLGDLDRIERAVEELKIPPKFASEAYTLREHVRLVRARVLERRRGSAPRAAGDAPAVSK